MPFVVRHLGDRVYGFWALAVSFIGYYNLLDFGFSSAVSQYICVAIGRNDQHECRSVFNTALGIQSLFGCCALVVTATIAAATPWFSHNPADAHLFWQIIVILGVNAAIGFPSRVYGGVLEAVFRFDVRSWLEIFGTLLRTGLIVWAISSGGALLALAWMTFIATLPVTLLQIWFAKRYAPWARIQFNLLESKRTKSLFSYSLYSFVAFLGDILRFQIDPLIISGFIGLAAVTHYRVAGVLAQYYLQIIIVSVGMLQPVLSRLHGAGNRAGIERVFYFGTKLSACISVFICLGLIGWGKLFITRWMGVTYQDAYLPLVVLSLAVFLDVSQNPSVALLYATFKNRFHTYTNWSEGVINLGFSLVLARRYGILGVAMGTLIGAFVIRVLVQPWWVCKVSGIQYSAYVRFFLKTVLYCTFLMGAAIAIVSWGLRPNYPFLVGTAIVATLLYAVGAWFFIFAPAERAQFLMAITKPDEKQDELPSLANVG